VKMKKILIVYNGIGDVGKGMATKEKTFNKVIEEMVNEGRVIKSSSLTATTKSIVFEDGSKVLVMPLSRNIRGLIFTHLYIDSNIFNLDNGKQFVNEVLEPLVVGRGEYQNLDANTNPNNRIFIF
jgi:hypothetical protein